jgi:hypothetical protein
MEDSFIIDDEVNPRSRRRRRPANFYENPIPEPFVAPIITSSEKLLSHIGSYDGVVEFPYPARANAYLTTYPFTERDVKKYAWLFAQGTEDAYLSKATSSGEDNEYDGRYTAVIRPHRRSRSPYYDDGPLNDDMGRIFLSRALDPAVVPEQDANKNIRYWIVVRNRNRAHDYKLLVAESRKAAGMLMYYEALNSNSVVFVGAVELAAHQRKRGPGMKVKWVENLEEAAKFQRHEKSAVGIVC